ncbi:hypothetical protein R6Z07M_013993 [Ovis aries]
MGELSGFAKPVPSTSRGSGGTWWSSLDTAGLSRWPEQLLPYDISNGGQPGGGGEYEVQEEFSWTSGVVLMLLDRYGDQLSSGAQTTFLAPHCLIAALLLSLLPQ